MRTKEVIVYSLISLVIITLMWMIKPVHSAEPRGIYLPIAPLTQPSKTEVTLYESENMPRNARALGLVRAQYFLNADDAQGVDTITHFAIATAQENGANGLVITRLGHTNNLDYPSLSTFTLTGIAIYVPEAS